MLKAFFEENPKVALAFSGGVDSAYLLYAAVRFGADVRAYYVKTPFQPAFEYEDALRLAGELGAEMVTIHLDVLSDPAIAENPKNRCYFCKIRIFTAILEQAKADGYSLIITEQTPPTMPMTAREWQLCGNWRSAPPCGNAALPKQKFADFPRKRGCSPTISPPMPAWPPGFPQARPSQRKSWQARNETKAFCESLALRIFAFALWELLQSCKFLKKNCPCSFPIGRPYWSS